MSGFSFGTGTGTGTYTTVPSSNIMLGLNKTTTSTGFGLGSSVSPAGLTFGSPATTTVPGLSFGTTPNTGLSFGSSTFGAPTVSSATPTTGIFATAPTGSTGQSAISFGQPVTAAQPVLGFGAAAPVQTTGLSFGVPASSQGGLSLGTPAPSTSASVGFSFGSSLTSGAVSTAASTTLSQPTGISFGSTPASSSTALGGATTSTCVTKPVTSFGTLPATSLPLSSQQSSGFNLGTSVKPLSSTATSAGSVGLGGVDASQTKAGQAGATSSKTDRAVKENQVPNEIKQTIDGFKTFVKTQKSLSSDIARGSAKPLHKVQEDTESLRQMLTSIKSGLQRNRWLADRLKIDTAKSIHDAEMAQRTHDTPPGLQYDNTAPLQYFSDLVTSFENEMQKFRQEIENAEKHLQSLCEPVALTPQELSLAMRHLHDSFVALAGRLQTVHNSVEAQKEQYLNLRKYFLKDPTNVFDEAKKSNFNTMKPIMPTRISLGPTPFSPMGSQHTLGLLSAAPSESTSSFSAGKSLGWGGAHLQMPPTNMGSSFTGGLSSLPVENQSFQLQKPPLGNKRGKR